MLKPHKKHYNLVSKKLSDLRVWQYFYAFLLTIPGGNVRTSRLYDEFVSRRMYLIVLAQQYIFFALKFSSQATFVSAKGAESGAESGAVFP